MGEVWLTSTALVNEGVEMFAVATTERCNCDGANN